MNLFFLNYKSYLNSNNSNEGKKEEGIFSYGECEYFFCFLKKNSNEDNGAKFWVHFKMKPKF